MERFFDTLFGHLPEGLLLPVFAKGNDPKDVPVIRFCGDTKELARVCASLNGKYNVYFGLCPLSNRPPRGRGNESDVGLLTCFWADLDVASEGHKAPKGIARKEYPPTKAAARDLLHEFGLAPTIVVDSGNGLHAYWVLREPIKLADGNRGAVKGVSMAVSQKLLIKSTIAGYSCDQVGDLARIFRVPGTLNIKTDPPKECRIIESSDILIEACVAKYISHPELVQDSLIPGEAGQSAGAVTSTPHLLPSGTGPQQETNIPMVVQNLIERDDRFRATWQRRRRDMKDGSASGYDQSIANQLVECNVSDQTIIDAIFAWREKHGESTDKLFRTPSRGGQTYIQRTITKAKELYKTSATQQKALDEIDEIIRETEMSNTLPATEEEAEATWGVNPITQKVTAAPEEVVAEYVPEETVTEDGEILVEAPTLEDLAPTNAPRKAPAASGGGDDDDPKSDLSVNGTRPLASLKDGESMVTGARRDRLLQKIYTVTGVNIVDVERQGLIDPIFYITNNRGDKYKVGGTDVLFSYKATDKVVWEQTGFHIPLCSPEKWNKITNAIALAARIKHDPETESSTNARDLLTRYVHARGLMRGNSWRRALPDSLPFHLDNGNAYPNSKYPAGIYVSLSDMMKFANDERGGPGEKLTKATVREWLSVLKFCPQRVDERVNGVKRSRAYWFGEPTEYELGEERHGDYGDHEEAESA